MWTRITEDKATWPPWGVQVLMYDTLTDDRSGPGYIFTGSYWDFGGAFPCVECDSDPYELYGHDPSHWMPLPQPPTE